LSYPGGASTRYRTKYLDCSRTLMAANSELVAGVKSAAIGRVAAMNGRATAIIQEYMEVTDEPERGG
jgi:hypothetical protein